MFSTVMGGNIRYFAKKNISILDDFFEMGGDSLIGIQMMNR